ncbi:MAG: phytanoyl-CoA dioxygenase family protein, partial [Candidatus Poribacteria bacterium]|nr:phytanoyl-CoA dioxygenase family protein [Candidatus Poribacteria bacterium]
MTDEEKFIFDLDGYIVIKDVLTQTEVDELNRIADEQFPRKQDDDLDRRTSRCTEWGQPFVDLMDHPKVVPYLIDLFGPKFRLDHDYCIFMSQGGTRGGLHGGEWGGPAARAMDHWYRYRDGQMRNGLMVVTYFGSPAAVGDGGFSCIPGSHKSNFLGNIPGDVRPSARAAPYVRQPAV